jgi:hypothetical protein
MNNLRVNTFPGADIGGLQSILRDSKEKNISPCWKCWMKFILRGKKRKILCQIHLVCPPLLAVLQRMMFSNDNITTNNNK